jgi:hypothetical protein
MFSGCVCLAVEKRKREHRIEIPGDEEQKE